MKHTKTTEDIKPLSTAETHLKEIEEMLKVMDDNHLEELKSMVEKKLNKMKTGK